MKTLKNWLLLIIGIVIIIADQGFDFINPFLIDFGVPEKWISIIKMVFGIYALVKLKKSMPTQNLEKLKAIIDKKIK